MFKTECIKWIDYFGLKCWQIHYEHELLNDARAEIRYNCVDGIAVIILNTEWEENANDKNIKKSAFHEVCELLLGRLTNMASNRFDVTIDNVEEETHRIIRTLENTIYVNLKVIKAEIVSDKKWTGGVR